MTVARAVELKHKASLISALTNETSKLFTEAGEFFYPGIGRRQRRRQRQRKRHLKIYLYFICAASRLSQLAQLLQKWRTIQEPVGVAYKLRKKMKNSPSCVHVLYKILNVVISC